MDFRHKEEITFLEDLLEFRARFSRQMTSSSATCCRRVLSVGFQLLIDGLQLADRRIQGLDSVDEAGVVHR